MMSASDLLVAGTVLLIPFLALITLGEKHLLHAIIARGMLGVAAAIAYALIGAPDVALTEALMGALLVTLLYVVVFTSTGEFRVGYVELPPLVHTDKEKPQGFMVDLLEAFAGSAGIKARFVLFENGESLKEARQEGVMDMAIGPFVQPHDSGDGYLNLPVVETMVYPMGGGEWLDILRVLEKRRSGEDIPLEGESESAFYSILISEDAHDLRDMLLKFTSEERHILEDLRSRYLGERA